MKKVIILFILCPFLLSAQETKIITVIGESSEVVEPDEVELSIYLVENENLKKENELLLQESELRKTVSNFGIDETNLTVENYSATSLGAYGGNSNRYRLSKTYKLKLTQLEIIDQLTVELFKIGADNVKVTKLESKELEDKKDEVLKSSLDKAKEKAAKMAEHMGMELGDPISIYEYHPVINIGQEDEIFSLREAQGNSYWNWGAVSRAIASEPSSLGLKKIYLNKTVIVRFQLK